MFYTFYDEFNLCLGLSILSVIIVVFLVTADLLMTFLVKMIRINRMRAADTILKMPHALMMVGRRISMFSGPAMCSGISEMD